jgi:RNA polymerase sigma factor (sigma-70 family)
MLQKFEISACFHSGGATPEIEAMYNGRHRRGVPSMNLDPDAIEKYRTRLRHKVCYHLGFLCPDIDDIIQETLSRFLRVQATENIRNPGAYLSGVCNNVILEYRRQLWKQGSVERFGPESSPKGDHALPALAVEPEADSLELRDAIRAALSQLSERDRNLLRSFYLEEKTKQEICQTMSMSDGQFRVALFRAKDKFREAYRQGLKHATPSGH